MLQAQRSADLSAEVKAVTIDDAPSPPTLNSAKATTPTGEEDTKPKVVSRQKKKSQKRRMTDSEVVTELSKYCLEFSPL